MTTTCLNCGSEVNKKENKFCNRVCAGTYNGYRRRRTKESKEKSSNSLKRFFEEHSYEERMKYQKRPGRRSMFEGRPVCRVRWQACSYCKNMFWARPTKETNVYWSRYRSTCSDECYIAVKQHNCHGTKKIWNGMLFDSTWEIELAMLLNEHGIEWVRCTESIPWIDVSGKNRKYFPDFYIPQVDVYCDTKNAFLMARDAYKLDQARAKITLLVGKPRDIFDELVGLAGIEPKSNPSFED